MNVPNLLTHEGETLSITQWARRTGMSRQVIHYRLRNGWSIHDTLTQPMHPKGRPLNADALRSQEDARRAHEDAQLRLRSVHRSFRRLLSDVDRALRTFNHDLSMLIDRGVVDDFSNDPKDRGHPSAQETT
jgi:hypothetical protein